MEGDNDVASKGALNNNNTNNQQSMICTTNTTNDYNNSSATNYSSSLCDNRWVFSQIKGPLDEEVADGKLLIVKIKI